MQEIRTAALQAICSSLWEIGRMNVSTSRAGIEVAWKAPDIVF